MCINTFLLMFSLQVIARARNGFTDKFGVPRQSGRASAVVTRIVFEPDYRIAEALRGIEHFSHLWLLWGFSANKISDTSFSPTVRPPRLGGNKRLGVFATRSPFRPNPIGLSSVRLLEVKKTSDEGIVLLVEGADMMDGTPIYDIKPYVPYTDIHTDATGSFAEDNRDYHLEVDFPEHLQQGLSALLVEQLVQILADDPRPAYQQDEERIYGLSYDGYNLHFRVEGTTLYVVDIQEIGG